MLPNFKEGLKLMGESVDEYPWYDPYAYALYLSQTYYYVSHSTRLLATSAGMMKMSDMPFHRRFLEHAAEEKGHELMVLNDMKALGFDLSSFPELPATKMFWEPQYYKIQHNDPLSLMGYIIALEAIACEQCPRILKLLESTHPSNSYSFVKVHGEEDPDHVQKAWQQIESLPPQRRKWVEDSFEQTVISFNFMTRELRRELLKSHVLKAG